MVGPCLCGDPYCGSCGDPSAAILEEAENELCDLLAQQGASLVHYTILSEMIPTFIKAVNKAIDDEVRERMQAQEEYIEYLKGEIAKLYV